MNGLKTLVLQDLTHVLPTKTFPLPPKLSSCNLHTAASARRFWNFFEFSNKDEVPRDSEQCQASKDIVPPERIAGEMREIVKVPKSAPAVFTSMSVNPRMQRHQQLQDQTSNCWSPSEPIKEESLMSLLDGNSVPKTMKWKLKGYKTLRRRQTDEFAFVPGGIYDIDVDLVSDVQKAAKNELATAKKSSEPTEKDIILSTRAIEAKDHPRVGSSKRNPEDSNNGDQPAKPAKMAEPSPKVPVLQKAQPLPKAAEQIKFLPISKPEVPTISMKCQSQPTARYSSQPPGNSQKPPLQRSRSTRMTAGRRPPTDLQETSEPSDAYPAEQPRRSSGSREAWRTEAESNVREDPAEMEALQQTEAETEAVDVYQDQLANNRRVFATATEERATEERASEERTQTERTRKDNASNDFAPGPWKHQRNEERHTYFQGRSDQKSLYRVYESIGVPPREAPPMRIAGPDLKQLGRTSPCAATHARLQQGNDNPSQGQQDSYGHDDGSSMAGNGGGSRKPPPPYPPFTSRRSSSSNSTALDKPLRGESRTVTRGSGDSRISSSNISTTTRRSAPRKCDDDDGDQGMIEGKTICTKPRNSGNNKCSRQRDEPPKKPKQCKRYCCPALQLDTDCDWAKSQCPKQKGECGTTSDRKIPPPRVDPTCLPPEEEHKTGKHDRDMCTSPRRSCGRRERNNQSCKQQSRQRCKRERRSCDRRERTCDKQERRQCDRDQGGGREICTKPRRRESCDRRRECSNDRNDCNRRATKCNGRRNYTNSAYTRKTNSRRNMNRFFSLTTFGLSLVDANRTDSGNTLFRVPSGSRFYGKDTSSTSATFGKKKCKKPPAKCLNRESSDGKCKSETKSKSEQKCGLSSPKCKIDMEKKEGSTKKESSTKKNLCDTSCGKSQKKEASTEADRCAKRRQQICKSAKASSSEKKESESDHDRVERERKEMQECKKIIGGKDKKKGKEEKKAVPGLERVISPCKSGKGSSACGKASCVAVPLNSFPNPSGSLFLNSDCDFGANTVSDRLFSTSKFQNYDHVDQYDRESTTDAPQNDYSHFDDEVFADSGTITNVHQQLEDMSNDSPAGNNWFLSWFHS